MYAFAVWPRDYNFLIRISNLSKKKKKKIRVYINGK